MPIPVWSHLSLQCSGLSDSPGTSDCSLEACKIGTGPWLTWRGDKVAGIYPALKANFIYSNRSIISQSWTQSSPLLVDHLWVTPASNPLPPKSQRCSVKQVTHLLNHQSYFLQCIPCPDQRITWSKTPQNGVTSISQKVINFNEIVAGPDSLKFSIKQSHLVVEWNMFLKILIWFNLVQSNSVGFSSVLFCFYSHLMLCSSYSYLQSPSLGLLLHLFFLPNIYSSKVNKPTVVIISFATKTTDSMVSL